MDEEARRAPSGMARLMALTCVRNAWVENIRASLTPVTRTADGFDVTVVDTDGRRIPWPEASYFGDEAIRDLMRQVANRLYTLRAMIDGPALQAVLDHWHSAAAAWNEPELDREFMKEIEAYQGSGGG